MSSDTEFPKIYFSCEQRMAMQPQFIPYHLKLLALKIRQNQLCEGIEQNAKISQFVNDTTTNRCVEALREKNRQMYEKLEN